YMLIFFGYTYCPTICPTNLEHMAWALEELGERAADIQPIFVTIDPARDTPGLLRDYVASFDANFVALTGEETEIARIAKAYRIHRVKVVPEGSDADDYLVDHSSTTYLMGPDGKFLTLFPHNTPGDVMAQRIAKYLDLKSGHTLIR
ncbi:MAG: SCO family protein, partial [Fimbriimonadaceae bacterium]|nr:SCO family protein [Alphaproteobacteria bacterium]